MRRPTEIRLRRAFADAINGILATAAGALAVSACASTGDGALPVGGGGPGGTQPEYTSVCRKGASYSLLSGLTSSPQFDGAIMRTENAFAITRGELGSGGNIVGEAPPEDGDYWKASIGERVGAICEKASDKAKCLDKVEGYRVLPPTREECVAQYPGSSYETTSCRVSYILYSRGDEIGVARNEEEMKALARPFDTLEEALWIGRGTKLSISCSSGSTSKVPESQYRTTADGGFDLLLIEAENCGKQTFEVIVHVDPDGNRTEISRRDINVEPGCAVAGRRPEGLRPRTLGDFRTCALTSDAVGEHFASMAELEAASVVAFRRLGRQLKAHGAPHELLERIRKAARDEIRHARATRELARKYGAVSPAPQIAKESAVLPSLFDIARENAREGCVRETYGALVAHVQMARATDQDVRATMIAIADEETEHAALSWDIAAWIESRLDDDQRAALARERVDAFRALARELAQPIDRRLERAAGVPAPAEACMLLTGLEPLLAVA